MKKTRGKKRALAWLLALAMLFSLMPAAVFADTQSDETVAESEESESGNATESADAAYDVSGSVEVLGVTYTYTSEGTDGTQIGDTGIYYTTDGEALTGTLYGTAALTYEEYYEGYVTEGYEYDAITTATTGDYAMFDNQYTDYDEETSEDGYNILGVTNVNIAVDAEIYVGAAILSAAGVEEMDDVYAEALEITLNEDYTTAPSQYKTLNVDGSYSGELNVVETVTDASAVLSTNSTWGEYEIDVYEDSTLNLRNSRSNTYTDDDGNEQTYAVGSNITGIILTTTDGYSVGLAYLANIWIQPYKLSFNTTDTAATKNIAYSGDTEKYAALVAQTISSITYLTADGAYVYEFEDGIYVKDVYTGSVTGAFSDDLSSFTLDSVPEELENPVLTVSYTVGSGRNSTSYTLYEGTAAAGEVTLDTSEIAELEEEGTYSVSISSDNYADIDVDVEILDEQLEELQALIEEAEAILAIIDDETLAAHKAEAEELVSGDDATLSAADELISELEELIGAYTVVEISGITYLYTTSETDGFTQIGETGYYYAAGEDALTGTLYGTAALTYEEYYEGYVTEGYEYDAITTATTGDYAMFDNQYTDYDEETSEDGYNILGVTNVNIAVDAEIYVGAAILSAAGVEEMDDVYAEALEITLNEDYTTAPSQYKTLNVDGSYSGELNVVETVTDASAVLSTNSTWGEYEIDVYEDSTLNLRNSRSNTYTDDDGNEQTYAVGSNITGIILTTTDGYSVGLAYLANIWIQPYKLSFNTTDTAATKNIAYSGDTEKYAALVAQTISSITYLTADGAYVYEFEDGIYVKDVYTGSVTGAFSDDLTAFTLDSVPEELQNAVLTVSYTVGSGRNSTSYTLYEGTAAAGEVTLDTSVIEGLSGGTYSVSISSDNYADIDVTVEILAEQVTDLEDLIAQAQLILSYTSDATLASHVEEALTLLASENADMSEAYDLIDELEELIGAYPQVIEVAGANRYETNSEVVSASFESSTYAVIATGTNYPDALAAASLAGALDAPIILVKDTGSSLTAAIEEMTELGVTDAYIVGGTSAVSADVESAITEAGFTTERVAGETRIATAAAIADKVLEITGENASDTCIVATSAEYADALSASPYAYVTASPIYLAKNGEITDEVLSAITEAGYTNVIIIGGTSAVSESTQAKLEAIEGLTVTRQAGENRYATAIEFAAYTVSEGILSYDNAVIATGTNYPDALSASALCGVNASVILLARDNENGTAFVSEISDNQSDISTIYIVGGEDAVSSSVREQIYEALYTAAEEETTEDASDDASAE